MYMPTLISYVPNCTDCVLACIYVSVHTRQQDAETHDTQAANHDFECHKMNSLEHFMKMHVQWIVLNTNDWTIGDLRTNFSKRSH